MNPIKAAKAGIFKGAWALGYEVRRRQDPPPHRLEVDPSYAATIASVRNYTMTPVEKIAALVDATRYIAREKVPGAFVECGVWRGGSMMAAARTLLEMGEIRDLYLFDTYAGMTEPEEVDVDLRGRTAKDRYLASAANGYNEWCYASLEDVRQNLLSTGYPKERCHFIQGDVVQTLPHKGIGEIAMLRLDTDWYESTLHELNTLYPDISVGGVLIIDDYGYWEGCKKAVDEYFAEGGPLLVAIDAIAKIAVKTESHKR
ncbi:TylF/MycF/NovP-related O-methyltransferase [Microbaculum marinum]|uniref:TylF/MycF/NovP-related O-methyltransferase n=1 Tax=Microbaculum marinum TaxID=1764581 RepID=A0AAW9RX90_9HYPH